jgi:hypothetical protein
MDLLVSDMVPELVFFVPGDPKTDLRAKLLAISRKNLKKERSKTAPKPILGVYQI